MLGSPTHGNYQNTQSAFGKMPQIRAWRAWSKNRDYSARRRNKGIPVFGTRFVLNVRELNADSQRISFSSTAIPEDRQRRRRSACGGVARSKANH